jgi:hypothetical protein
MPLFPSPFNAFYSLFFLFKRIVGGHCPGVVTSGDSVTHMHFTEMRRLAHDETPFLLAMPPRYMPMDLIGRLMMRPPIHQLGLELLFYFTSPLFLLRSLLLLSQESLGKASQGFNLAFNFCQLLLPSGPLAPSSHKARYNPY